jgi:hypothetical protein
MVAMEIGEEEEGCFNVIKRKLSPAISRRELIATERT